MENLPRYRRTIAVTLIAGSFGISLIVGSFTGNFPGAELAVAVAGIIGGDSYLRTREKEQGVADEPGRN